MSHVAVIRADMGISLLKADSKGEKKLKKKKHLTNCHGSQKSLYLYAKTIKLLTAFYPAHLLTECFRTTAGLSSEPI